MKDIRRLERHACKVTPPQNWRHLAPSHFVTPACCTPFCRVPTCTVSSVTFATLSLPIKCTTCAEHCFPQHTQAQPSFKIRARTPNPLSLPSVIFIFYCISTQISLGKSILQYFVSHILFGKRQRRLSQTLKPWTLLPYLQRTQHVTLPLREWLLTSSGVKSSTRKTCVPVSWGSKFTT